MGGWGGLTVEARFDELLDGQGGGAQGDRLGAQRGAFDANVGGGLFQRRPLDDFDDLVQDVFGDDVAGIINSPPTQEQLLDLWMNRRYSDFAPHAPRM